MMYFLFLYLMSLSDDQYMATMDVASMMAFRFRVILLKYLLNTAISNLSVNLCDM